MSSLDDDGAMDGSAPHSSPPSTVEEQYGAMAVLSASPASATGFHALYSSPGPRRTLTDEIDLHDLEPDSDAESEDDTHSAMLSPHTSHSPAAPAAAPQMAVAPTPAAAAAPAAADPAPVAAPSPVATSLDDALTAPPPTDALPASPAAQVDDASSMVSSDEGSSEAGSVASLPAHLLSASSSPITSPTATRASLDDLLHSMASPPASATTTLAEQQQQHQPPGGWANPADDSSVAVSADMSRVDAAASSSYSQASAADSVAIAVPSSPSRAFVAAAPVEAGAQGFFSSSSPRPLGGPSPVFEPDCSGFKTAFEHVAASLDALQQTLQQEVAADAAFSAAEQREFDSRTAALRRRSEEIEEALRFLATQRTQSAERLEQLQSSLLEQRAQISELESSQHELESARAELSAARARRMALDYARAQPVHVLLRHTEGSIRGAHREYLRLYRREQKAAARANCNDNIHDSASESDGEDSEGEGSGDEERGDEVAAPAASASPPAAAAAPSARTARHNSVLSTSSRGVDGLMARRDSKAAADRARRNSLPHVEAGLGSDSSSAAAAAAAVPASPADGGGELDETSENLPADWVPPLDSQNRPIYPRRYGLHTRRGSLGSPRLVLPRPVLEHLWTFLGVRDLQSCAAACRDWKGLLMRPAPQGTRVWKLLHQRVSGVDLRLRIEREREKAARRATGVPAHRAAHSGSSSNPHSLPRQSATMAGSESGSSSPQVHTPSASPSPASRSRQGSAILSSTPGSAAATGFVSVPVPSTPNNDGSSSGSHTPSTPAAATPGKAGLLGGMLRRFRGGSTSNLNGHAAHSGTAAAASAGAHRGSWLLHPSDPTSSFPPTHLHYTLRIEIPSRDSYLLTIEGQVARSLPTDPRVCLDELESDSSKGQNSVSMHVCTLRGLPHPLADEAEFCSSMFALQANLTQARIERAKIIAQIDGDEGVKKQITSEIQAVS